jgi:hypothetical protein
MMICWSSGEISKAYGNYVRKISTKYSLFKKLVVDDRIILKYILENSTAKVRTRFILIRRGILKTW